MKYRKAIFIIVYSVVKNKPQYLLLKRKLHWKGWEFPKGGIERFELLRSTLKRELKEETGITEFKIKKKIKINESYKYNKNYPERKGFIGQRYKQLFLVEVKKQKIKVDNLEHEDYKWVDFDKAIKMLTWENQKKLLKIANKKTIHSLEYK